jgi:hypothetical protein
MGHPHTIIPPISNASSGPIAPRCVAIVRAITEITAGATAIVTIPTQLLSILPFFPVLLQEIPELPDFLFFFEIKYKADAKDTKLAIKASFFKNSVFFKCQMICGI